MNVQEKINASLASSENKSDNNKLHLFKPVRTTEAIVRSNKKINGALYLTTDTQKMFLGLENNKMIEIAKNKNFFYGHKEIINNSDSGLALPKEVRFSFDEIDMQRGTEETAEEQYPEIGDLILNIDGSFYKIKSIFSSLKEIVGERLTVSGSGGGGGGGSIGPSGPGSASNALVVSDEYGQSDNIIVRFAESVQDGIITFKASSLGKENNKITKISFYLDQALTKPVPGMPALPVDYDLIVSTNADEHIAKSPVYSISIMPFINRLKLNKDSEGIIYVKFTDNFFQTRYLGYTVHLIDLTLTKTKNNIIGINVITNDYEGTYGCDISGTSETRIITYTLSRNGNEIKSVDFSVGISSSVATNKIIGENEDNLININTLEHGIYDLSVQAFIGDISSNILTHKILLYKNSSFPLVGIYCNKDVLQYEETIINFMAISSDSNKQCEITISLGAEELGKQIIKYNTIGEYRHEFENIGSYNLFAKLALYGQEDFIDITVREYDGQLPIFSPRDDSLELFLVAKGKNNSSKNKYQWEDVRKISKNEGKLSSNFYFGTVNGWLSLEDEKNGETVSRLRVSQSATVEFNTFEPFFKRTSPLGVRGRGYTFEFDFKLSGITDYKDDKPLISYLSYNNNKPADGFLITGNSFKFYIGGTEVSNITLEPFIRTRLSIVIEPRSVNKPLVLTYLNGIVTQAKPYGSSATMIISDSFLKIDSTYAVIDLYNIRFYNIALNAFQVLNNYQASFSSNSEKEEVYRDNLILDDSNKDILFAKVRDENYPLKIPYVKITGGYDLTIDPKDKSWKVSEVATAKLPTGKKDYRLIDIEVVYPDTNNNEYFTSQFSREGENAIFDSSKDYYNQTTDGKYELVYLTADTYIPGRYYERVPDYKNIAIKSLTEDGLNVHQSKGKTIKSGAIMYAQGTSSMGYPVKNLRVKTKGNDNKFIVKPGLDPVNLICFKADYMESSGSHNTGAGNFIDAEVYGTSQKTPGQTHYEKQGREIVTAIKGYPCVIFWSKDGTDYQYIGKYNMNLDKATPEPFGFEADENDDDFGTTQDKDGNKVNSIYCFEFLDNFIDVCNFLPKSSAPSDLTEPGKYDWTFNINTFSDTEDGVKYDDLPGWREGFEPRYPEIKYSDREGLERAGEVLWPLASWINELYNLYKDDINKIDNELKAATDSEYDELIEQKHNTYKYIKATGEPFSKDNQYWKKGENDEYYFYSFVLDDGKIIEEPDIYTRELISSRFVFDSLERFKNEYTKFFDHDFLVLYYVVTEMLLMADSRVKNMMIATWGPEPGRTWKDQAGEEHLSTEYIWYPIFYDMDTMFGLTNEGTTEKFNYMSSDDRDNNPQVFNGSCVLWILVKHALRDSIVGMIDSKNTVFTLDKLKTYFTDRQSNMANEVFYNEDAEYKYINTYRAGDMDTSDDSDETNLLHALQGNRSLNRENFIKNRLQYLNGKYKTTSFKKDTSVQFRYNKPTAPYVDDPASEAYKIWCSTAVVPPGGEFVLTPVKTGYYGVNIGFNNPNPAIKFYDEDSKDPNVEFSVGLATATGTEGYILGANNLLDFGPFADKYPQLFSITGFKETNNVLQSINLGHNNKFYYNPMAASILEFPFANLPYLQTLNLRNLSKYIQPVDLSQNQLIKEVDLMGSGVTDVTLPKQGIIEKLYLPKEVSVLKLDNLTNLTEFAYGEFQYDYIGPVGEGHEKDMKTATTGEYVNDYSYLQTLQCINIPPVVDTYGMIKHACDNKKSKFYCHVENVEWTIESIDDLEFDAEGNCKIKILEYLRDKTFEDADIGTYPAIVTGQLTIDLDKIFENSNDSTKVINEYKIYLSYIKRYPELKIRYKGTYDNFTGAYSIKFYYNQDIVLTDPDSDDKFDVELFADGVQTIAELLEAQKKQLNPTQESSPKLDYNFNQWIDAYKNTYSMDKIKTTVFNEDIKIKATYYDVDRIYEVNFCDRISGEKIFSLQGYYEDRISDIVTETDIEGKYKYPNFYYNWKNDSTLIDKCYAFKGWTATSSDTDTAVIDFANNSRLDEITTDNKTFYSYFREENVKETKMSEVIFSINFINTPYQQTWKIGGEDTFIFNYNINGYALSVRPEFKELLKGKITIPSTISGNKISYIQDCTNLINVSKIYFENGSDYKSIGITSPRNLTNLNEGFSISATKNHENLIAIYLPDTLEVIGPRTFNNLNKLEDIGNISDKLQYIGRQAFGVFNVDGNVVSCENLKIENLPNNLQYLDDYAFYRCTNVKLEKLPDKLQVLGERALNDTRVNITQFGNEASGLKVIYAGALRYVGTNVTEIIINPSIQYLARSNAAGNPGAFTGYTSNEVSVIANKSLTAIMDTAGIYFKPEDTWESVGLKVNTEATLFD